jgi:hypothetical protein
MKTRRGSFRLHVDEESTEIARTICDADPRVENKRRALRGHITGELERCHRVCRWMFDALPYLAHQLSVFYWLPTEGYTRGGKFRLGDAEIRNSKVQGTQGLDRFGPRCA